MAPCSVSSQSKPCVIEDSSEDQTRGLDEEASLIPNACVKSFEESTFCSKMLEKDVFEPGCEESPFSSSILKQKVCGSESDVELPKEPEMEPDEDDKDEDFSESNVEATSRQLSVSSKGSEQDWEPIVSSNLASNLHRQTTDENWPTYNSTGAPDSSEQTRANDSSDNRPPGTFFEQWSEQQSEPCMTTWMMPYPDAQAMSMHPPAAMFPTFGTVCAVPILPQSFQIDGVGRRSSHRRRPKRESPLDIAKRQLKEKEEKEKDDVKFCPWCGGRFRPCYNFCMYCGEEYNKSKK